MPRCCVFRCMASCQDVPSFGRLFHVCDRGGKGGVKWNITVCENVASLGVWLILSA